MHFALLPTRLRSLLHVARLPVLPETRAHLARSWAQLPDSMRTPQQMYGRQGNGCGATIGAMPRCDFACRGCYLGEEANRIPAQPVEAVKAQMRALRPALGNAGNLQLTDGEVTLRPEHELVELLRYAHELRLVPMLMTHGDTFRRHAGLLERLMVDGGLSEVSIHIDTTQRGRMGAAYRYATSEEELNPLREEFARMIRGAQHTTRLPLRCATTMTVTGENLEGVPAVMRWLLRNADAVRMISLQPAAQVGRTAEGLGGGVDVTALWDKIAEGLGDGAGERLARGEQWMGHPACNRYVTGIVADRGARGATFHPVREIGDPTDARVVGGFLRRFGGITFRRDTPAESAARLLGVVAHAPWFVARNALPYTWHWLRRLDPVRPIRAAQELATGALRLRALVIVSHHFMSRAELETPVGRERLDLCVFRVPIGERLVPMCEVNALGVRQRYYAAASAERGSKQSVTA